MFYFLIFIFLILLRYALKDQSRLRNQIYPVVLLSLFLFSAFRMEVGCDWSGYLVHYNIQHYEGFSDALAKREPLYWAIIEVIHLFGLPYPWVNVFTSAVFFAGVHVLARRQPDPLGFLILLFPILIINMPMTAIRQGAAIGLMCIAFAAFIDKRLLRFVVWTVIASTFHVSALVFLLLAPLVWGDYSRNRLLLAALLALPGAWLLANSAHGELATSRYIESELDSAGAAARLGMLVLSGLFFFLIARRPWAQRFPQDYKLVNIGALMMLGVFFLLPLSTVIGDRIGYYLVPIQAMIFARLPWLLEGRTGKVISAAPYLGLAFVFGVWSTLSGHFKLCYLPYDTWLFGFPENAGYLF